MKRIAILLIAVTTLFACSKNDDEDIPQQEQCLVAKLSDNTGSEIALKYDNTNRLTNLSIKINSESSKITVENNFSYTASSITVKGFDNYVFDLDNNRRIIAGKGVNEKEQPITFNFSYTPTGQLTKSTRTEGEQTIVEEYTYTNDNLTTIQITESIKDYTWQEGYTLNYDITKGYAPLSLSISSFTLFNNFDEYLLLGALHENGALGKKTKNRITTFKDTDEFAINYTYKEDTKGKVITTSVTEDNSSMESISLSYICR